MQLLSIPDIVMASINFYVGFYYLFFYLKRPQIKEHLPFALLCLSVGLYDIATVGLFNSSSISTGIIWQRIQLEVVIPISIFLIWFTSIFTKQKKNLISLILIVWLAIVFFVSLFINPEFSLSVSRSAIKDITIFNSLQITYYEGEVGLVYQIEILSAIVTYIYLVYLFIREYQKKKHRTLLLIIICQITYFFGVVNDSLVATRYYAFVYFSEYTFFLIILAMAYALLDNFVNIHAGYEELTISLEQKVSERTSEIQNLNVELKHLADFDGLTGVYNRRFFNEYFEIEVSRAKNCIDNCLESLSSSGNDQNFGLAIIDVDHFKKINDSFGHLAGDKILTQLSEIMKKDIFTRDVLCRYGGDEFALLLTRTSHQGILQAVEKIRREIDERAFILDEKRDTQHITISAGLVSFDEAVGKESLDILKVADDRLLKAKIQGRNRIVYSDD